MVKKCKKELQKDSLYVKQLLDIADNCEFDEVVAYLYYLQGDLERAFNMYLFMKSNKYEQFKIFGWLEEAFGEEIDEN